MATIQLCRQCIANAKHEKLESVLLPAKEGEEVGQMVEWQWQ